MLKYLGSTDNTTEKIKTPIEDVIFNQNNLKHLLVDNNEERLKDLNKAIRTLQEPNIIVNKIENGKNYNYYIKSFNALNKKKAHLQIIKKCSDGNFYVTNYSARNSKLNKVFENGNIVYKMSDGHPKMPTTNIISDDSGKINPKNLENINNSGNILIQNTGLPNLIDNGNLYNVTENEESEIVGKKDIKNIANELQQNQNEEAASQAILEKPQEIKTEQPQLSKREQKKAEAKKRAIELLAPKTAEKQLQNNNITKQPQNIDKDGYSYKKSSDGFGGDKIELFDNKGQNLGYADYRIGDDAIDIDYMSSNSIEKGVSDRLVTKLIKENPNKIINWDCVSRESKLARKSFIKKHPDLADKIQGKWYEEVKSTFEKEEGIALDICKN